MAVVQAQKSCFMLRQDSRCEYSRWIKGQRPNRFTPKTGICFKKNTVNVWHKNLLGLLLLRPKPHRE